MLEQTAMNIRDINIRLNMEDIKHTLNHFLQSSSKEQKEDFAELIEGLFIDNEPACGIFIKIALGNKLPSVIPDNTLVKVGSSNFYLSSGRSFKYKDADNKVSCKIVKFNGWHLYTPYSVEYTYIDANGDEVTTTDRTSATDIEVIEEF
jgi:hypothetical protein